MEYFDVLTPDGGRTGQVKERSAVHRDGDWHGTAHIWLVRKQNGRLQVLLQKRSRKKETFPGCFDTSCAGHLSAGDSFEEGALRELSEELGIRAQASDLFSVGLYSYEVKESFGGTDIIDREIAAVYLYQKPVAEAGGFSGGRCRPLFGGCCRNPFVRRFRRFFGGCRRSSSGRRPGTAPAEGRSGVGLLDGLCGAEGSFRGGGPGLIPRRGTRTSAFLPGRSARWRTASGWRG